VTVVVSGLTPGNSYYFAHKGTGTGNCLMLRMSNTAVVVLTNARVDFDLSWSDDLENATGHFVYWRLESSPDYSDSDSEQATSFLSHKVVGLDAGQRYCFIAKSYDGALTNISIPSNEVCSVKY
ncbi:MAG: hypothetical protein ACI9BF_000682, partial [Candidatus Paceibacteria bacterium]